MEVNRCCRVQSVVEQAASSVYMDSRSVALRGTLAPGRYVVLPTTFLPGATGRFLLRIFCHFHVRLRCACMFDKEAVSVADYMVLYHFALIQYMYLYIILSCRSA